MYSVRFGLASVNSQYHTSHCKFVVMTVVAMTAVVKYICLLENHCCNQNYMTTSQLRCCEGWLLEHVDCGDPGTPENGLRNL